MSRPNTDPFNNSNLFLNSKKEILKNSKNRKSKKEFT